MDIRILTLLLFISVTGSFAELRSPLLRARRNGLQENDRPLVSGFAAVSRTRRESSNSNTTKSTTVPTTTPSPTTVTLTDPESTPSDKVDPTTESIESDSNELTSSPTPGSSSTTGSTTPEPSPKTVSPSTSVPRNKPKPTTSKAKSTTPSPIDESTKPEATSSPTDESTEPKSDGTTIDPSTQSVTTKLETVPPSPTTTPATPSPTATTSSPTTKSVTPKAKPTKSDSNTTPATGTTSSKATTEPTTTKPSNAGKPSKPVIGSRFNTDDEIPVSVKNPKDETREPMKNPEPASNGNQDGPVGGYPMNPGFPTFPFPPFFVPNFVPDFSYPSNPYGDPTFNSIPAVGNNNAWIGPSNGGGLASSFASASASAGAGDNSNYNPAPLVYREEFPEQPSPAIVPTTAVEPNMANMANMANTMPNMPGVVGAGGYGYGGDAPFFDPNSFAFPGYNLDNLQKLMEDHFKQLQAQFQRQQQAIFEASNRIGATDGSSAPGPHTAYSGISLGPGGGYQAGAINPAAPGVESRFGEELPAPAGNRYGVFSSSSSHTQVGPDGKTVSHKSSTTGVNDNGKITFRTVHD